MAREESQTYPYSFFMESGSLLLLVPDILCSSIRYITFMNMVRCVLQANPERSIEHSDMVSLWDAIIYIIYHFESSRSLEEGRKSSTSPILKAMKMAVTSNHHQFLKAYPSTTATHIFIGWWTLTCLMKRA